MRKDNKHTSTWWSGPLALSQMSRSPLVLWGCCASKEHMLWNHIRASQSEFSHAHLLETSLGSTILCFLGVRMKISFIKSLRNCSLKDPYHYSLLVQVCHHCPPHCPGPAGLCFRYQELWLILPSCSGGLPELVEDCCLLHSRDRSFPRCPGPEPISWSSHLQLSSTWMQVLLLAQL